MKHNKASQQDAAKLRLCWRALYTSEKTFEVAMGNLKDSIDVAKGAAQRVGETPDGKEAVGNLGKAAVTVTQTINNALLPLAAVNFGFEKAREYFATRFAHDLSAKTSEIPTENVQEPKASVAGPALQGLAFTHEERELREMYLSLLATAMDDRSSSNAHPAFVEIIKQLDADEIRLLDALLKSEAPFPVAEVRVTTDGTQGHVVLMKHLLQLTNIKTGEATEQPRLPAMVDNWVRLGLVDATYAQHLSDEQRYTWVEERPEFKALKEKYDANEKNVTYQKGFIERTQLGAQFARAVGILESQS